MLKDKIKKVWKEIKNKANEKIEMIKNTFLNDKNRVIIGIILIGTGLGFVASRHVKAPA